MMPILREVRFMPVSKAKVFSWIVVLIALVVGGAAGYLWIVFHWSYSKGERAGYVQKFSQKGWLCKTWEGELLLVAVPGSMPEKFFFTVRDDSLASKINTSLGKRVSLSYEQHKGIPTTCFGETEYFAQSLKVLE
jgi:hypothetical protein